MICCKEKLGRHHGHRGLAAEPGPREVRGCVRENEIDETVLPDLTADDLKDLGVSIVGHRRKLLDAIAVLPSDTSAVECPAEVRRVSAASRAERRQVTVMFSELVQQGGGPPWTCGVGVIAVRG